jgi:5'-nucleotidase
MFLKKIGRVLVALAIMPAGVERQGAAQQARTVTVQLLAINDFHGNIEPPTGSDGLVNRTPAGGVEYLATHLRIAARNNPNSILVGAGDLMGASPLISGLLHDGPTIEAMNAMNMSVTSIGNHELDHGPAELFRRIAGGCLRQKDCSEGEKSEAARFQYLAANVVRTDGSGGMLLPSTAVRTVGGMKIGFIGETLEDTPHLVPPESVQGLRFLEESAVANAAAAQLELHGVHAIVLLIHQGGQQQTGDGQPDPNGCANFDGPIKTVAGKLSPSIKVVISGHSHRFYNCEISGHTVTSAGSFGRLFTRVNLSIDRERGTILSVSAKNEVVTRDVAKDLALTAIIDKYRPGAVRISSQPVGSITGEISNAANSAGESALGDVITDAQLASVSAPEAGGAVVAFTNSSGIRAGMVGIAGPNGGREVSYGDLYATQPFGNRIEVRSMTGDMIRRLLEQQFQFGANPNLRVQVSEGFTYRYRLNAPAGQRVMAESVALHGHPIAATDLVRVAATDFLFSGGGGLTVLGEGTNPTVGPVDVDALVDYVRTHSPVAPGPQNRIVRLD